MRVLLFEDGGPRWHSLRSQSGYRIVRGADLASIGNADASGFTLGGALKFGGF